VYVTNRRDPWWTTSSLRYDQIVCRSVKTRHGSPVRCVVGAPSRGGHYRQQFTISRKQQAVHHTNAPQAHMLEEAMPGPPPITFTNQTSVFPGRQRKCALFIVGRGDTLTAILRCVFRRNVVH